MRNKMRLFQDYNFTFSGLNGLKLDKLVICADPETKKPIVVYIQVETNGWYKFFIEEHFNFGVLFGVLAEEIQENIDIDMADDSYDFIDYTEKLQLYGQVIKTIYCISENNSCKIVVDFMNGKNFILKTANFKPCEFIVN